jgi:hypothetical protein
VLISLNVDLYLGTEVLIDLKVFIYQFYGKCILFLVLNSLLQHVKIEIFLNQKKLNLGPEPELFKLFTELAADVAT